MCKGPVARRKALRLERAGHWRKRRNGQNSAHDLYVSLSAMGSSQHLNQRDYMISFAF